MEFKHTPTYLFKDRCSEQKWFAWYPVPVPTGEWTSSGYNVRKYVWWVWVNRTLKRPFDFGRTLYYEVELSEHSRKEVIKYINDPGYKLSSTAAHFGITQQYVLEIATEYGYSYCKEYRMEK